MVVTASEVARRPGMFLGAHAHDGLQGLVELVIASAVSTAELGTSDCGSRSATGG